MQDVDGYLAAWLLRKTGWHGGRMGHGLFLVRKQCYEIGVHWPVQTKQTTHWFLTLLSLLLLLMMMLVVVVVVKMVLVMVITRR